MRKITKQELFRLKKPIRYIGDEFNQCLKEKDNKVRVCNAYSNLYEIGAKNLRYNNIYYNLNMRQDCYTERVFFPDNDLIYLMNKNSIGLQTLETKDFINEFEIIIFNINDPLEYINVLKMLQLSNIPLYSKSRIREKYPFIIGIGDAVEKNLSPLSEFFDLFIIGQVEEVLNVVLDKYIEYKYQNLPKIEFLRILKNIQGIYIPYIHSNTLIYEAKNLKKCVFNDFFIPNMYECFYSDNKNSVSMEVISSSKRLRKIFRLKDIKNEYLVSFFSNSIKNKVSKIKIKFFLGLPSENYDDLKSICRFIKKIVKIYDDIILMSSTSFSLEFKFENFIIYPHTKFEWLRKSSSKELLNKKEFIEKILKHDNENISLTFENPYLTEFKQLLLFSDEKISKDLEFLLNNGFLYYNTDRCYNIESIKLIDVNKYKEYFESKDINYKFPFDMIIISGNEKIKLKKEYKNFILEQSKGESYGK